MNEQQLADELGGLIDNSIDSDSGQLPADEAAFALRLLSLRDQTFADDAFADALEARLKAAPRPPFRNRPHILNRGVNNRTGYTQGRMVYAMASLAAALVIFVAAILTVPALHNLTQPTVENIPTVTAALPAPTSLTGYEIASTSLRSGYHALGRALNYDDFTLALIESAFTSYLNFMSSD